MTSHPHLFASGNAVRALGLDAGGSALRWALADAHGQILDQGQSAGWSALLLTQASGQQRIEAALHDVRQALHAHGPLHTLCAGVTGLGEQAGLLRRLLARIFALPESAITLYSDIELACRAAFLPGTGILVYAGTGSIGAHLDAQGVLHRVGGHGYLIDDAGSGYWIAKEAFRRIWRWYDEAPEQCVHSALAQALFAEVGGCDWDRSRTFFYAHDRGEIGMLARIVGATADHDPLAAAILDEAGRELARLATALRARFGPLRLARAGRVFSLHPRIASSLQQALPDHAPCPPCTVPAQILAAQLAARQQHPSTFLFPETP